MEAHAATVRHIADQVAHFHRTKTPFRIYHGSTLSTRTSTRQRNQIIDTSSLNHVLHFNREKSTVLVEPNVPMDALVTATLKEGLLPKIVMELPNITVGGGFAGTSGESSSFRYGLFDRSIRRIEIVLGNGETVWASRSKHRDLFFACAGSCGSLGVITLLEMDLIDARRFVELTYIPVFSVEEAVEVLQHYEQHPATDYLDGIMYSMSRGVIMVGRLEDKLHPGAKVQTFDKPADPWFYLHAETVLKEMEAKCQRPNGDERRIRDSDSIKYNGALCTPRDRPGQQPESGPSADGNATLLRKRAEMQYVESIPIQSYLFRYDRGVFWSGLRAFDYFLTPFNRVTRYLLDPYMYTRTMIHALHRSGLSSQAIIQDLAVPYKSAKDFITWTDERTGLWPLWLCPVRTPPADERSFSMSSNIAPDETILDVGIWGMGPTDPLEFIKLNRDFEAEVKRLRGLKCLYAHAYYTEDEFWEIYDEKHYKTLRKEYHAESLPSVYEKVKVDLNGVDGKGVQRRESWQDWAYRRLWDIYPLRGLYGVASATKGLLVQSDYLLKK